MIDHVTSAEIKVEGETAEGAGPGPLLPLTLLRGSPHARPDFSLQLSVKYKVMWS